MSTGSYVSTEWVKTVTKEIDQIPDCKALEELIKQIESMIKQQLEAMLQQIADLAELAIPPTSLKKLIKWCKKHAAFYYEQYLRAVATYAAMAKAYADLLNAIQKKLASLDCRNIKMPSVSDIIPALPENGLFATVNEVYGDIQALKSPGTLLTNAQAELKIELTNTENAKADAATKRAAVRLDSSEPRNPEPTGG